MKIYLPITTEIHPLVNSLKTEFPNLKKVKLEGSIIYLNSTFVSAKIKIYREGQAFALTNSPSQLVCVVIAIAGVVSAIVIGGWSGLLWFISISVVVVSCYFGSHLGDEVLRYMKEAPERTFGSKT
jgi:hypothetical protein